MQRFRSGGLFCLFFFTCSSAALAQVAPLQKPDPKTLRVHQPQELVTLDWSKSAYEVDSPVLGALHEGLVRLSLREGAMPALAKTWTVSADGKRYLFTLRSDAKWSDGQAVTAQHFVDAWKRLLSPLTATPYANLLFEVEGAQDYHEGKQKDFSKVGMKAITPQTLEVKLRRPTDGFLLSLGWRATFPVRMDLIQKHGNVWTKAGVLVTAGPYMLAEQERGKKIVLKKNPYYYGQTGNIERIEFLIRPISEALTLFSTGQVDLVFKPSADLRRKYHASSQIQTFSPIRTKRLSFQTNTYPASVEGIRQAVAHALDRRALAAKLGAGFSTGATLVPPGFPTYTSSGGLGHDPEKARKLLRRSGVPQPVELSMLVPAFDENGEENARAAAMIKEDLEKSGFKLTIEYAEEAGQWKILSRAGSFNMLLHDWKADFPDPYTFYVNYSTASQHTSAWSNLNYKLLLEQARHEVKSGTRSQLYRKLENLLVSENAVMVPLYYAADVVLRSARVTGLSSDPYQIYDFTRLRLKQ